MKTKQITEGLKQARKNVGASKCWDGYKAKGTKKKNGKEVPNCVKEEELSEVVIPGYSSGNTPTRPRRIEREQLENGLKIAYTVEPFEREYVGRVIGYEETTKNSTDLEQLKALLKNDADEIARDIAFDDAQSKLTQIRPEGEFKYTAGTFGTVFTTKILNGLEPTAVRIVDDNGLYLDVVEHGERGFDALPPVEWVQLGFKLLKNRSKADETPRYQVSLTRNQIARLGLDFKAVYQINPSGNPATDFEDEATRYSLDFIGYTEKDNKSFGRGRDYPYMSVSAWNKRGEIEENFNESNQDLNEIAPAIPLIISGLGALARVGAPMIAKLAAKGTSQVAKQAAKGTAQVAKGTAQVAKGAAKGTAKAIAKNPGKVAAVGGAAYTVDTISDLKELVMQAIAEVGNDVQAVFDYIKPYLDSKVLAIITKYGIPAAAIIGLIWGGTKLWNYLTDDVNEARKRKSNKYKTPQGTGNDVPATARPNLAAKHAQAGYGGGAAGAHKDRKKDQKRGGRPKHKKDYSVMDNVNVSELVNYLAEFSSGGGTSAAGIATVVNPHTAKKKTSQKKNKDGTVKNALDTNAGLLGSKVIKR